MSKLKIMDSATDKQGAHWLITFALMLIMRNFSRRHTLFLPRGPRAMIRFCIIVLAFLPLVAACDQSPRPTPSPTPNPCPPGQYEDNQGKCANAATTTFVTCIEGRTGNESESVKVRIEVAVDAALKAAHVASTRWRK